jgi:hypothetical protein
LNIIQDRSSPRKSRKNHTKGKRIALASGVVASAATRFASLRCEVILAFLRMKDHAVETIPSLQAAGLDEDENVRSIFEIALKELRGSPPSSPAGAPR